MIIMSEETAYYDEEIMEELGSYHGQPRPTVEESERVWLNWLRDYSYNGMELCRIINGIPPAWFIGCNKSASDASFHESKGGCTMGRGCRICYQTVHSRLMTLNKKGKIRTLKLHSFDSRKKSRDSEIPTDLFRFFYTDPETLAMRLHQDIECMFGTVTY